METSKHEDSENRAEKVVKANLQQTEGKESFDVVALAASAGGLNALSEVLSGLPGDLLAPIIIVQHLAPHHNSLMAEILGRRIPLLVKEAAQGDCLHCGTVYIAPPNYHLLVNLNGILSLTQSELVNFVRPSADLLFNSVAKIYQKRAIAVILTGTGHDGTMGVQAIHQMGGTVIVQDPATAEFSGMPSAAIETGVVDLILPLSEIAPTLISLVGDRR